MAQAGKITVNLETQSAGWTKGLADAGKDVSLFVKNAQSQFKALSFGGGFNAAGVAKFGTALNSVAQQAASMASALRTGASYGEVFGEAVNKIPIVGQFKQAGEAIRELVTGEKAAVMEAEKMAASAQRVVDAYRKIAQEKNLEGLRGQAKESEQIEQAVSSKITDLHGKRAELQKQLQQEESKDFNIGWYTDAQKANMARIRTELKANDALTLQARKHSVIEQTDLEKHAAHDRELAHVESERRVSEVQASMKEVALRRQGRVLESAMMKERELVKKQQHAFDLQSDEKARPYEKSAKTFQERGDTVNAKKHRDIALSIRADYAKQSAALDEQLSQTLEELQAESNRRQQEMTLGNEEKLKEVRAHGNIERLKMQDEHANALNEQGGIAQRSHLAEAAEAEEEYRKTVAEIEKKYREDKHGGVEGADENRKAQLEAAAEEKKNKLGLLAEKAQNETAKNQETLLKDQRRLWEEAGDESEKYAARLADINEQFAKLHDARLRDAQIAKLDETAFEDLRKANPDHEAKVELYGRTLGYAGVSTGKDSSSVASQQLAEIKKANDKTETRDNWLYDIWQYFQKQVSGAVQEINI